MDIVSLIITILVFLLVLSVLVLIHEYGHFWVAKKAGIKVEEFGFGFPPRAFSIKKGETVYSINWLPIGGFVKLYGEDEAGGGSLKLTKDLKVKDEKHAFYAQSVSVRAAVVVAGVVMNMFLAVVIFYAYLFISDFKSVTPVLGNPQFVFVNKTEIPSGVIIADVLPNSPAKNAGITSPSIVLSLNNQKVLNIESFRKNIQSNKGKEIMLSWQEVNTGAIRVKKLTPRTLGKNPGTIGVSLGYTPYKSALLSYDTIFQKAFSGVSHSINAIILTVEGLKHLFDTSVREKSLAPIGKSVSGPIGIATVVGIILQIPDLKELILNLLNVSGLLSISLAFMNVLPIPALDGGRLFFILIEAVSGKKVNQRFENLAHAAGMALLLTMLVYVTFQDIWKIVFNKLF